MQRLFGEIGQTTQERRRNVQLRDHLHRITGAQQQAAQPGGAKRRILGNLFFQLVTDRKVRGHLPQDMLDRLQPVLQGFCQIGDGMHAPKDVLDRNGHRRANDHGKAQPERIFGTLVNREEGFIHRGIAPARVKPKPTATK